MKIIFSTYEAKEIGGSYLRSLSLAEGLVKLGHEVTLWTSAKHLAFLPKMSHKNGVKIIESVGIFPYRFRKGGYDLLDLVFRSVAILFTPSDLVQSFNHRPTATVPAFVKKIFFRKTKWFMDWADLWGKGGIADRRGGPLSFLTKNVDHYMERFFIRQADTVTAISDDLVEKAIAIRGDKSEVFFLGVGTNINQIQVIDKKLAKKKLHFSDKTKFLAYLYVGTYDAELLAKVFIALNKLRQDVRLMLLGPNLPDFDKQFVGHKQAFNRVLKMGIVARQDLQYYLAAADLMLLPFADKEINRGKFPNKLGDYLAAGRPIVANPTGEVRKLLQQHRVGLLVSEDPQQFALAINDLLNKPKTMAELGQNARLLAEQSSWLMIAKQLESFYLQ